MEMKKRRDETTRISNPTRRSHRSYIIVVNGALPPSPPTPLSPNHTKQRTSHHTTHRMSSGVAMTTKLIALSLPKTSYAHRRMLRMALTAATPLFAISTFSMTRPPPPMAPPPPPPPPASSDTYAATFSKRRCRFGFVADLDILLEEVEDDFDAAAAAAAAAAWGVAVKEGVISFVALLCASGYYFVIYPRWPLLFYTHI